MIKKLTVCFLVMVIAVGCSQAPVVEQPQKPEEEIKVKKIDESKDWVVIEQEIIGDLSKDDMLFKNDWLIFENGNDFENWFNTIYTYYPVITDFYINIDNEMTKEINKQIKEQFNIKPTVKVGNEFLDHRFFISDKYLSVIVKEGTFHTGSGHKYNGPLIYNYDLVAGELMTNTELLKAYQITEGEVLQKIQKHYDEVESLTLSDDLSKEENYNRHGNLTDFIEEISSKLLFVNSDGNLIIMIDRYLINKGYYLSTDYEFQLAP